jgi:26S proteasome regulatory subunit N8
MSKNYYEKVVIHPLVLLSTVDHFTRIDTEERVVGVLLGSISQGVVDVTNSFACIFFYLIFSTF